MTSSNKISLKLPSPEMRSSLRPWSPLCRNVE